MDKLGSLVQDFVRPLSQDESCDSVFIHAGRKTAARRQQPSFAGQSGVGKSTLLNAILGLQLETGAISRIERGKHTTRHASLIACGDIRVMDTPGFSLLEFEQVMDPVELKDYYPEFAPYEGKCRFQPCYHGSEPGCAVRQAEAAGSISSARMERYRDLLEKTRQLWRERYD